MRWQQRPGALGFCLLNLLQKVRRVLSAFDMSSSPNSLLTSLHLTRFWIVSVIFSTGNWTSPFRQVDPSDGDVQKRGHAAETWSCFWKGITLVTKRPTSQKETVIAGMSMFGTKTFGKSEPVNQLINVINHMLCQIIEDAKLMLPVSNSWQADSALSARTSLNLEVTGHAVPPKCCTAAFAMDATEVAVALACHKEL